jgi:Fe2+ or Zn2+ uptake regulation protein
MATREEPIVDATVMLRQALGANGQRITDQRAAVYRYLCSSLSHPTADELFTAVRAEIPDISLATVYKALETLVGCGLAVKLSHSDGSARYDSRTDEHAHSRCAVCGLVADVAAPRFPANVEPLALPDGFRVERFSLEIVGTCAACTPPG